MIRLGITTTALGMILFGVLWDEVSFIGFYILLSIGTSIGGFMTVSVAVVTWFERKRSRAIGFMSMGFTFGTLLSALVGILIFGVGWREASIGTGAFLLVVGWGLSFILREASGGKGSGDRRRHNGRFLQAPVESSNGRTRIAIGTSPPVKL